MPVTRATSAVESSKSGSIAVLHVPHGITLPPRLVSTGHVVFIHKLDKLDMHGRRPSFFKPSCNLPVTSTCSHYTSDLYPSALQLVQEM
jgi:hypothetical protein